MIRVNLILAGDLRNGQFPSHCLNRHTTLELAVVGFAHKTAGSFLGCYNIAPFYFARAVQLSLMSLTHQIVFLLDSSLSLSP